MGRILSLLIAVVAFFMAAIAPTAELATLRHGAWLMREEGKVAPRLADVPPALLEYVLRHIRWNLQLEACNRLLWGWWTFFTHYRLAMHDAFDRYVREYVPAGMTDAQLAARDGNRLAELLRYDAFTRDLVSNDEDYARFYAEMQCFLGHLMQDAITLLRDRESDDAAWVAALRTCTVRHAGMIATCSRLWSTDGSAMLCAAMRHLLQDREPTVAMSGYSRARQYFSYSVLAMIEPTVTAWAQEYETRLRQSDDEARFTTTPVDRVEDAWQQSVAAYGGALREWETVIGVPLGEGDEDSEVNRALATPESAGALRDVILHATAPATSPLMTEVLQYVRQ